MKKVLLIGAAIIAIAIATPKFLAAPINQKIDALVKKVDSIPGYKVSMTEYQSGWFTSSASISIDIDTIPSLDQHNSDLLKTNGHLIVNVQHGPILLANEFSLGLAAWSIETDKALLRDTLTYSDSESFYSIQGNTGFSGDTQYSDTIASFSSTEDIQITFSGWSGKGAMSTNNSHYSGVTNSIDIGSTDTNSKIEKVTLDIQLDDNWFAILENPIYNSTGRLAIDAIKIAPSGQQPFTLDEFVVDFETEKNTSETLSNIMVNYGFKKLKTPTLSASDFIMAIELKNLEKEFLKAYQNIANNSAGFDAGLQNIVENNLLTQLQASPELNINELSINIDNKSFSGNLLTKIEGVDALPTQLSDYRFWLQHTKASTNIKLNKALAFVLGESFLFSQLANSLDAQGLSASQQKEIVELQVKGMLNGLISQGLIIEKDESYEADIQLEKGQAVVNGKATPLPF